MEFEKELIDFNFCSPDVIDHISKHLAHLIIRTARSIEKKLGLISSNGLGNNKRLFCNERMQYLVREIRKAGKSTSVSNFNVLIENNLSNLRKELRKLQRLELFESSKNSALKRESLFHFDKSSFWWSCEVFWI